LLIIVSSFLSIIKNTFSRYSVCLLNDCVLNTLTSEWYIELKINNVTKVQLPFFNGSTYSFTPFNAPSQTQYYNALISSLDSLKNMGYDYYLTDNDTVIVYNQTCQTDDNGLVFTIDIGINFQIYCS
jgi:hypothetical protein